VSEDSGLHEAPSTGKLLRFTGWNLFGLCAPMAVAFFALPPLRGRMGEDIYGAFMFLLTVINYLSILDLGLGRAATQFMSARLASRKMDEIPPIFWTVMAMMLGLSLAGMMVFFPLVPSIVCSWSKIPPALQADAVNTLFAAGIGTPFLVLTACLVGVLEAHQKFKLINIIRLPMQIYTFLGPLAVALISHSLLAPVVALLAGKAVECAIYFGACLWEVPLLRRGVEFQRKLVANLFALGGWMSVSSIAMLALNQLNSVLMFGLLPVAMVGYYATIAEMIIRLLIFPRAWVSVLFPSFSAQHALESGHLATLYAKGFKSLVLFSFPVVLVLFTFAGEALTVWQDAAFSAESAGVMRWLAAGIFVYSLSFVPFSLLQGVGRPDISAKLHLVEIPFAAGLAWMLMKKFGIEGAGIAWLIRCVVETVVMTILAQRFARGSGRMIGRSAIMTVFALLLMLGMALVPSFMSRLLLFPVVVYVYMVLGWFWLLAADERQVIRSVVSGGLSRLWHGVVRMTTLRRILISFLVALAVWLYFAWPIPGQMTAGISSSSLNVEIGGSRAMIPGDHLQLQYQFWLTGDTLRGHAPAFVNPYEFNVGNDADGAFRGTYYFPFSVFYVIGEAIGGRAFGYNFNQFVTIWIAFLFTWLLVRRYVRDEWVSAVAATLGITLPYVWISMLDGSPTGLAMMWIPVIFWSLDILVAERKAWAGAVAGLGICLAEADSHVFFYAILSAPFWCLFSYILHFRCRWPSWGDIRSLLKASIPLILFLGVAVWLVWSIRHSVSDTTLVVAHRSVEEIRANSPPPAGIVRLANVGEGRKIYIGGYVLTLLAAGGLALLWLRRRRNDLQAVPLLPVILLGLAILGVALLSTGVMNPGGQRAWKVLTTLVPPYGMIRQPHKIYCLMPVLLALAVGFLWPLLVRGVSGRWRAWILIVVMVPAVLEYGFRIRPTVCVLDREQGAFKAIAEDAKAAGNSRPHLLSLPIWPGDSHFDSLNEYYVSLYGLRMVNGYGGTVLESYRRDVFQRLEGMNVGAVSDDQLDFLLQRGIGYVVLHEDCFPEKVSPFPVGKTLESLMNHPRLKRLGQDGAMWSFKILAREQAETSRERVSFMAVSFPSRRFEFENLILADPKTTVTDSGKGYVTLSRSGHSVTVPDLQVPGTLPLFWNIRTRGQGRLAVFQVIGGVTNAPSSVEVNSADWDWQSVPIPDVDRVSSAGVRLAWDDGRMDLDTVQLVAGRWAGPAKGKRVELPAACFFHAGFMDPAGEWVTLRAAYEPKSIVFYGPKLPLDKGSYSVELIFDSPAMAGTPLGQFNVRWIDSDKSGWVPVTAGDSSSVTNFEQLENLPFMVAFEFFRVADIRIRKVILTRIN